MNLIKIISLFFCFTSIASADPVHEFFLDHTPVKPGKNLIVDYKFPTDNHIIECHQDVPASHLGSLEWQFNGNKYKVQIGDMRSIILANSKMGHGEKEQIADPAGKLIFTNLDNVDLYVTCSYILRGPLIK